MTDLLDIVPATAVEVVKFDGHRLTVRGISIAAIAAIVARFPNLRSLASGDVGGDIVLRLIQGCGEAAAPIIAAGCGHPGDETYEEAAARLLPDIQIRLIRAIFGLTFPNGLGSFVQELTSLMGGAGEETKPIKVRLKRSPSTLPPSSDADSHQTMQ